MEVYFLAFLNPLPGQPLVPLPLGWPQEHAMGDVSDSPQGNADWDSEASQTETVCNLAWAMKVDCVESAARVELTDAIQTRNVQLENDTLPLLHR